MNIRRIVSTASVGILSLGVVVACGDDEGTPTPPASSSSEEPKPAMDAGADAEVVTSEPRTTEVASSSSVMPDAAADDTSSMAPPTDGTMMPDAGAASMTETTSDVMTLTSEPGDGGSPQGDGGMPVACEGSEGANDYAVCADRASEWCDSPYLELACDTFAASWDATPFNTFLDCLTAAFEEEGACEGDVYEPMFTCMAAARETACVTESDACQLYEGCQSTTVADCNTQAAVYNEDWIQGASVLFECGTEPSYALGG